MYAADGDDGDTKPDTATDTDPATTVSNMNGKPH